MTTPTDALGYRVKPWTHDEWLEIVAMAKAARGCRSGAKAAHVLRRIDPSNLETARGLEARARRFEARVRYFAEVRLKDVVL